MEYLKLTDAVKREIASANLLQVESEHYALDLRLRAYDEAQDVSAEDKRQMVEETRRRLASLEAAIAVYRAELERLE